MLIYRSALICALSFVSPLGIACTLAPSALQLDTLMHWVEAHRPRTVTLSAIPSVVQYKSIARKDRVAQCGVMCDHDDGKYDLNLYFMKANRIALVANARNDQLVHELVHAYQYAENSSTDGSDDGLEDEAIEYQQLYQEKEGRTALAWSCVP